ncbi:cytochrome P450 85A1-like [Fagus crenata]
MSRLSLFLMWASSKAFGRFEIFTFSSLSLFEMWTSNGPRFVSRSLTLEEEHLAIRERKKPDEPIDWNDYKSMSFTRAVILETSRLATVVNGVLRKTTQDVELNGFFIPKGWKIYLFTRGINYDSSFYPEPSTFNPWRWLDKSLESHKHCFLFGAGGRLCPGK